MVYWGMNISHKYIVTLSARERRQLKDIIAKGVHHARVVRHASVLLKSDGGMKDEEIGVHTGMSVRNISRVRKRYVSHGLDRALYDAPRPGQAPVLAAQAEATLVALACSPPPEGATRWTLALLRERMLRDGVVAHISTVAIWRHLADRGLKPWREKNVVHPHD